MYSIGAFYISETFVMELLTLTVMDLVCVLVNKNAPSIEWRITRSGLLRCYVTLLCVMYGLNLFFIVYL